jgi:hypothetical protein
MPFQEEFDGDALSSAWTVAYQPPPGGHVTVANSQLNLECPTDGYVTTVETANTAAGSYSAADNATFTFKVGDASSGYNFIGLSNGSFDGGYPYALLRNYGTSGTAEWEFIVQNSSRVVYSGHADGGIAYRTVAAGDTITFNWTPGMIRAYVNGISMGETAMDLSGPMRLFLMTSSDGVNAGALHLDSVTATVPEPSVMALVTTGLCGLLACGWRRRR